MRKIVLMLAVFMTGEMLNFPLAALAVLPLVPFIKAITSKKIGRRFLSIIFAPAAAITASAAIWRISEFVGFSSLPRTPIWVIIGVVTALVFYCGLGSPRAILKFGGVTFILLCGFVALSALLLIGRYQAVNPPITQAFGEIRVLLLVCEGITLLGLMPALNYKEKPFSAYLAAFGLAVLIGASVFLISGFALGSQLFINSEYSYYTALRIAQGGELIGRIEAFLIPILLFVAALKAGACIAVILYAYNSLYDFHLSS